jgi:polyphosphate kinase
VIIGRKENHAKHTFFDRDISWLSFNERVLMEAAAGHVPVMERMKFLAIYSSNLDEFYRVRMPGLMALHRLHRKRKVSSGKQGSTRMCCTRCNPPFMSSRSGSALFLQGSCCRCWSKTTFAWFITGRCPIPCAGSNGILLFHRVEFFAPCRTLEPGVQFVPENNKLYLAIVQKWKGRAPFQNHQHTVRPFIPFF